MPVTRQPADAAGAEGEGEHTISSCQISPNKKPGHPVKFAFRVNNSLSVRVSQILHEAYAKMCLSCCALKAPALPPERDDDVILV